MPPRTSEILQRVWFRHIVELKGVEIRTMSGVKYGPTVRILASVKVQARTVTTANGEEVTVAGTLHWGKENGVPMVGQKLTLPAAFGLKPDREIVTAALIDSGNDLTPQFVEVTIK